MDGLYQTGIAFIQWLQGMSPGLDGFMLGVTFLGTIEFYILFLPALYWSLDRSLALRALFVLILADIAGSSFKQLLHGPRPYWLVGDIKALVEESSYGIPSTHASNSLAVWGLIAYTLKKSWAWVVIILLLLLIGLTRPYLGVHFLHDVIGGWLLGLIMLLLFLKYENHFRVWWAQKTVNAQVLLGFLFSISIIMVGLLVLALISAYPDPPEWASFAAKARQIDQYIKLAGFLFGAVAGIPLMRKHANFESNGSALQKAGRYVLGMTGLFAFYIGLDVLFALLAPDASLAGYILRYVRYATVSFWAMFVAPWVFLKVGLAEGQVSSWRRAEVKTLP